MSLLGEQRTAPDQAREWRRHVEVIAAYRDQRTITADDPRQILGPYAEPGHAGDNAYWHAADSVLAARRLSGLELANSADSRACAQVAADIYDALPRAEREAIAAMIAETPSIAWLGDPDKPDEHAATRPGYADALTVTLARRGYLTADSDAAPRRQPAPESDPFEARLARRGRPGRSKTERPARPGPEHGRLPWQDPPRNTLPTQGPAPVR